MAVVMVEVEVQGGGRVKVMQDERVREEHSGSPVQLSMTVQLD